MDKRLLIFGLIILLVCLFLGFFALNGGLKPGSRYISPDTEREWARSDYERDFLYSGSALPAIDEEETYPPVTIDTGQPNEVRLSWQNQSSYRRGISDFGDRIDADSANLEATLPGGQKIKMIGVASWIPIADDEAGNRHTEISWRDPVSLEPLLDPESRGLEKSRYLDRDERKLILGFACSEFDSKPMRWHFPRVRSSQTLTRITTGGSWGVEGGVMHYDIDLDIFHNTPITIGLPVSFGPTETCVLEPRLNDESPRASFPSKSASSRIVFSTNGVQNGSSWGGEVTSYRWREATEKSHWPSFSLIEVWPVMQSYQMQWKDRYSKPGKERNWSSVHMDGRFFSAKHRVPIEEVKRVELRRFPDLAHCVFQLQGIPGLPKAANLFAVESGPVRFRYSSEAFQYIENATATKWNFREDPWKSADYPLEFENLTPGELLRIIETRTGKRFYVNRATHSIEGPPEGWIRRLQKWLKRIF